MPRGAAAGAARWITACHRLGFATEVGHRLGDGYVQRADLVVRAPEAGVPVMLLEIDRRSEDAHDLGSVFKVA